MSDIDFRQPGLGPLRAAAEAAELSQAVSGLVTAYGCRLTNSAPLARYIARSMTEPGLTANHCAPHDPLYRLGGICLLPIPAGLDSGRAGIVVPRTTNSLRLPDRDRYGTYAGIQQAMNTAITGILRGFAYAAQPLGSGDAWIVAGHRHRDLGAGR
jgi:hypothetical protein